MRDFSKYADERDALNAAFERDDEGLTGSEYFDKYASEGLKKEVEKNIREYEEAWKQGIAIG